MNKPTKPNITIPESFAANGVKADFDNNKILNGFDRIQPDVLAGDNLNKFIDDTYKASNYALNLGDYVLGKNQITNCILEAPNGVMEVAPDGYNFTLKQGLKVLIPNGRNTDGTLKNIEITLNEDATYTGLNSASTRPYYLFVDELGQPHTLNLYFSGLDNQKPTTKPNGYFCFYYAIDTNKTYKSTTTTETASWEECTWACVGTSNLKSSSSTLELFPYSPVNIATKDNVDGQWVDSYKYISKNVLTAGTYTLDLSEYLPQDGNIYEILVKVLITNTANGDNAYLVIRSDIIYSEDVISVGSDNNFGAVYTYNTCIIPARNYLTMIITRTPTSTGVELFGYRRIGKNV